MIDILVKIKNLVFPVENRLKFLQSNTLFFFVVAVVLIKIGLVLISINLPQNIFFADITKTVLESFVNNTRSSIGLNPLKENEKLTQAAMLKAENMIEDGYFDHTSPTGATPWFWFTKAGYSYKHAGENLAIGFFDSREVYQAWLDSPSHKANILNPNYTEFGTAIVNGFGGGNTVVVVQEFASPTVVKQIPVTNVDTKPKDEKNEVINKPADNIIPEQEKVLSQSVSREISTGTVLYGSEIAIQYVVYGIAILIIIGLSIGFGSSMPDKRLVFRTIIIFALLLTATLVNREVIISLIPHRITI